MNERGRSALEPENRPMNIQNEAGIKFQCDICNVSFKSDLDATRHLTTGTHVRNKTKFQSTIAQNKSLVRDTPKSLEEILKSLEVTTPKDLRALADKGYFEIVDQETADIAQEMIDILHLNYIEFMSKVKLPPELAERIAAKAKELAAKKFKGPDK